MRTRENEIKRVVNTTTGEVITVDDIIMTLLDGENIVVELINEEEIVFDGTATNQSLRRLAIV